MFFSLTDKFFNYGFCFCWKLFTGKSIFSIWLVIIYIWIFSLPSRSNTVLEEVKKTGVLKLGLRVDAFPFGYVDDNYHLHGLCLDFFALLKEAVLEQTEREIILVKLVTSNLFDRFNLVENNHIYLECGPNTINSNISEEVNFSMPFFVTGTQFLIRKEDLGKVNNNNNLSGLNIGVLRATTTEKLIETKYPLATLEKFQGTMGRLRGIQALRQKKIDAFASDGILLIGEVIKENGSFSDDYQLVPNVPLSCDFYGMILPKNDPNWQKLVNYVIQKSQEKKLLQQWLKQLSPQLENIENVCQNQ